MQAFCRVALAFLLVGSASGVATPAAGQELALAERGPRFLYAASRTAEAVEVDASRSSALRRVVSLNLERPTVGKLLTAIEKQTGLRFAFSRAVVPTDRLVALQAETITVGAALLSILIDTDVDVLLSSSSQIALVRRRQTHSSLPDGTIVGRVADRATALPIAGATVTVDGTDRTTTTTADGRYSITDVPQGAYSLRVRSIGYAPATVAVSVGSGLEVTVDFRLSKAPQLLQEVVTTGTIIPTEVKALPTPVSVITADEIAQQRPQALSQVIRQAIPTAVAFDSPVQPLQTLFSVRGVSSLSGGSPMKIFVDGVEASNFGITPVDPASIERIEAIRGPQAATLYGSDAAGGVVQIFTKRGDQSLTHPRVDGQAGLGVTQTPYDGYSGVLRQAYSGSVRGGDRDVSYNFGGGYTQLANYLPTGERSRQTSPSVYGGIRFAHGVLSADLSARYYRNKLPSVLNPLLLTAGFLPFSQPQYQLGDFTNETYGSRITISPVSWWHNQFTMGVDRQTTQSQQTQRRLTTPGDTLYAISSSAARKISFGYNSSLAGDWRGIGASMTVGIDHYDRDQNNFSTTRALTTQGTIQTSPAGSLTESRSSITNTGYFGQVQLGLHDVVFITGGLRAEQNSTFGPDLGTPVLPRVGLSVVQRLGPTTVKVRGAYGRAIRAPSPGQAFGSVGTTSIQLANPVLAPEQQRGWDLGIDLLFGGVGSLSVTGYDQTARDLITSVMVSTTPVPTFQFQNVGRVANSGVEIEGTLTLGFAQLRAQYGYVKSRIDALGPATGGTLQVGDRPPGVPTHTAGGSVIVTPRSGTTFNVGVTYVGSYRQNDALAQFRCFGGTGPCQPNARAYIVDYPGFAKINIGITQRLTRQLETFISVDNLANNEAYEGTNSLPVLGRTTMAGMHIAY